MSYVLIRLTFASQWTIGMRTRALIVSFLSWITLALLLGRYIQNNWNNNKQSKW